MFRDNADSWQKFRNALKRYWAQIALQYSSTKTLTNLGSRLYCRLLHMPFILDLRNASFLKIVGRVWIVVSLSDSSLSVLWCHQLLPRKASLGTHTAPPVWIHSFHLSLLDIFGTRPEIQEICSYQFLSVLIWGTPRVWVINSFLVRVSYSRMLSHCHGGPSRVPRHILFPRQITIAMIQHTRVWHSNLGHHRRILDQRFCRMEVLHTYLSTWSAYWIIQ